MEAHPAWTSDDIRVRREFLLQMLNRAQTAINNGDPDAPNLQWTETYVNHELERLAMIVSSGYVRD